MIYLTLPELLHVAERTLGPDYAVRDVEELGQGQVDHWPSRSRASA